MYLVLTYLIPSGISPLIRDELTATYHDVFSSPWPLLLVVALLFLVGVLYLLLPRIRVPSAIIILNPYRYWVTNSTLVVAYLVAAFLFQQEYGLGFRHTGPGMLGAALYVPLVFGLKVYFKVFALYVFLRAIRGHKMSVHHRMILSGAAIATAMSVMAATDIPLLLLMFGLALAPTSLVVAISCTGGPDEAPRALRTRLASYVLLVVTGIGAVFVGIANKIGPEETISLVRQRGEVVQEIGNTVGVRASMHYAVLMTYANKHPLNTDRKFEALSAPISDLRSRVCRLTGRRCQPTSRVWSPDYWSVSRISRIVTFRTPLESAGATPGLLGAALIIPFFPAGLLIMAMLATIAVRLMDGALPDDSTSLSLLGVLVLVYFLMPILNNFLDIVLRPLDPSFEYAALMLLMLLAVASVDQGAGGRSGE